MNAQNAVKQDVRQVSDIRLVGEKKMIENEDISGEIKKQRSVSDVSLTNGDPPQLMLWGSDE